MKERNRHLGTAAGRLLLLLEEGRRLPQKEQARFAWGRILSVDPQDTSTLLKRLSRVLELPEMIRHEVESQAGLNAEELLEWMPSVEKAFSSVNFEGRWEHFMQHFDKTTVYGLKVVSGLIRGKDYRESQIDEELASIHEQIRALIDEVGGADMDSSVQTFLLEHLLLAEEAIVLYKVSGIAPLRRTLEAATGGAILNQNLYKHSAEVSQGKGFWKIMTRIALVVGLANGPLQLAESVRDLITHTDPVAEEAVPSRPVEAENKDKTSMIGPR